MSLPRVGYRAHAILRMFLRGVSEDDVRHVLETEEVLEDYPDDTLYPRRLILGWRSARPLHVVAAFNKDENETIVITVYEPDPDLWETDFRRRKP